MAWRLGLRRAAELVARRLDVVGPAELVPRQLGLQGRGDGQGRGEGRKCVCGDRAFWCRVDALFHTPDNNSSADSIFQMMVGLVISHICRCFRSQERASAASVWWAVRREAGYRTGLPACPALPFPFGGRCVGSQGPGSSARPAPHCRSRLVGGAWGVGAPGAAAGLPRTSVPVRWAVRGEGGPRVELAARPRCCLCRCHAAHFGAVQKPKLREPQNRAEASDTVRLWGLLPYVCPAICGRDTHRCASQGLRSEASARAVRGGRGRCVNGCTRGYRVGGFPGCV